MVQLEKFAALIATDSVGVQKEAFFHSTTWVTLKNESEWTELIESGWNTLVHPTTPKLMAVSMLASVNKQGRPLKPYGNGRATAIMIWHLQQDLSL